MCRRPILLARLDWIVCDIDEGKAAKVGIRLPPEPEPEAT